MSAGMGAEQAGRMHTGRAHAHRQGACTQAHQHSSTHCVAWVSGSMAACRRMSTGDINLPGCWDARPCVGQDGHV